MHYKTEIGTPVRICLGTAIGSVPGLAKEIIDSTQEDNYFSGTDMAADVLGALAGTVVSSLLNDVIQVRIGSGKEARISVSVAYNF
ncbi:hypothetical protein ACFLQR_01405 [Verrucomicrobiota bacterium]